MTVSPRVTRSSSRKPERQIERTHRPLPRSRKQRSPKAAASSPHTLIPTLFFSADVFPLPSTTSGPSLTSSTCPTPAPSPVKTTRQPATEVVDKLLGQQDGITPSNAEAAELAVKAMEGKEGGEATGRTDLEGAIEGTRTELPDSPDLVSLDGESAGEADNDKPPLPEEVRLLLARRFDDWLTGAAEHVWLADTRWLTDGLPAPHRAPPSASAVDVRHALPRLQ